MTDKNHELYLEDIETAIAKTTRELMDSDEYNLRSAHESRREAFRKIAKQDVEIQRLRKYKTEDNKTIRNLRSHLQEATEEIECRVSTWESKEGEYQEEIRDLKVEIEKLKEYKTMIYCVWSDLYWADKGGISVSEKDISNSCDYYENEDFVRKEVVGDDEEEEEEEEECRFVRKQLEAAGLMNSNITLV